MSVTTPKTQVPAALDDNRARIRAIVTSPIVIAAATAILILIVGQILSPGFASYGQIVSMLRVASFLGIMAIGQTIVILSGNTGIDLSVGTVATFGAIVGARIMGGDNSNLFLGIVIPLLIGALLGAINGVGIVVLKIPPFVMTLGMMGVATGLALAYTAGVAGGRSAPGLTRLVNERLLFGIPGVVFIWIALIVIITFLLRRTVPGWNLFAVGTNRRAARLSGLPVNRTVIAAYAASGFFAVLGGLMMLGYSESVFLDIANDQMLPTVAAVIIGGTLAMGGVGGYVGSAIGACVLTFLDSFLGAQNMPQAWRMVINGLVLLFILALYGRQRRLRA
ncbi:Ribose ABC transport system, permease protein RbsC (TC 3.A.1.2.1) [Actinomycetales bacterium JB111]|nr:Ribose ABC transport system, permease protein RbsC (TC 3.A.1.2.1) [Actinomycetales bacterium JB111]